MNRDFRQLWRKKELFHRLGVELSYQCTAAFSVSLKDVVLHTRDVVLKTTYSNHRKEAAIMENRQDRFTSSMEKNAHKEREKTK